MLLQIGIPAGPELLLFNLLIAAVVGYFTYRDAGRRGANATVWAGVMAAASLFLSFIGFLVVFAIYYFVVIRD
jgi:hypothetical protein